MLKEKKLRELGVSFGDEDPAPLPAPSTMSRQTSAQYPSLSFSPPIPSSSASSSHPQHPNTFSPPFMPGSANPSSNVGSIASPGSTHATMHGMHNPRHSVSFSNGEHPFGSPFQYPQSQPTPPVPVMWGSPAQLLSQQGMVRGGSPAVQNLGAVLSPSSPFGQEYVTQNELLAQMQPRQQHLQAQLLQQQIHGARQSPRLQEVREADEEREVPSNNAEKNMVQQDIASPVPRGHQRNVSESLQKEIDEAEYHLEEEIQRQLGNEEGHDSKANSMVFGTFADPPTEETGLPEVEVDQSSEPGETGETVETEPRRTMPPQPNGMPKLHHPQPHSRSHSLSQRPFDETSDQSKGLLNVSTDVDLDSRNAPDNFSEGGKTNLSEIETNPSVANSPGPERQVFSGESSTHRHSLSNSSNPWVDSKPTSADTPTAPPAPWKPSHGSRSSKTSISKLNVEAKEFKFDPESTFKPGQFSFTGNNFQPIRANTLPSDFPPRGTGSKINAEAPVFKPSSREFSFSASGPPFHGPAFRSNSLVLSVSSADSGTSVSNGPAIEHNTLFGNIDMTLADVVKPPKKSKAIPIVRPDSSQDKSRSMDRPLPDGSRFKRAKSSGLDGDEVPQFSLSSMPLSEITREQSPPKESDSVEAVKPVDKENILPMDEEQDEERDQVPERLTIQPPTTTMRRSILEDSPDYDGKGWAPYEFGEQQEAANFDVARPLSFPRANRDSDQDMDELSAEKATLDSTSVEPSPQQEIETEMIEPKDSQEHTKKSSLSATAKPFQFTGNLDLVVGEPQSTNSLKPTFSESKKASGLESSRFADDSPPVLRQPSSFDKASTPTEQSMQSPVFSTFLSEPQQQAAQPRSDDFDYSSLQEPSKKEMVSINRLDESSDVQSEQVTPQMSGSAQTLNQIPKEFGNDILRSDAPSPSPMRFPRYASLPGKHPTLEPMSFNDDPFGPGRPGLALESPVHRLNSPGELPASDWDDVLSTTEEAKLHHRSQFFDGHVNQLVGGLLAERLDPLEKVLAGIQDSLAVMSSKRSASWRERRSVSIELPHSDADDEDDDEMHRRSMSPRKDRKLEKIRSIVTEALASHQSITHPPHDFSSIQNAVEELRDSMAQQKETFTRDDVHGIVEETIAKQPAPKSQPSGDELKAMFEDVLAKQKPAASEVSTGNSAEVIELRRKIETLERDVKDAYSHAEAQIALRRAAEDQTAECQRSLKAVQEEEVRQRGLAEEKDRRLRAHDDKRQQNLVSTQMRTALLEGAHENLQKANKDLTAKHDALEIQLREARQQVDLWENESRRAITAGQRNQEDAEAAEAANKELRKTVEALKLQMEESIRVREGLRGKFNRLQEEMSSTAQSIATEQSAARQREAELAAKLELQSARLEAEARTRERLEREIERLEINEKEGMRHRVISEQLKKECDRLDAMCAELRKESLEAQKNASRWEREFEEARDAGRMEVQRTRILMQADVETANNQVNIVRADLESQVSRMRVEMDNMRLDWDTSNSKHELLLEEVEDAKRTALEKAKEKYDSDLEDLKDHHDRQYQNALEDAQRGEANLLERLNISNSKNDHLQDRIAHLEEKLEIAKAAANAAAQAAQTARSDMSSPPPSKARSSASIPLARGTDLPEKISPQALRESIIVLQEQLQEREQRIESLNSQLSNVDLDAPNKLKDRDTEIGWLRELLAVRIAELQDLIQAISTDDYDPANVKDAAIRLKANLEMEQQERERAHSNTGVVGRLPSLETLKDFASPRAKAAVLPLAAAWGSWRNKGREASEPSAEQTPSRPSPGPPGSSQGFLSGLLTPPSTNAKMAMPDARNGRQLGDGRYASLNASLSGRQREKTTAVPGGRGGRAGLEMAPRTPPLMRREAYDRDADAMGEGEGVSGSFYDDDDESTVDGSGSGVTEREVFGPRIMSGGR
jgi:hypothetical protein